MLAIIADNFDATFAQVSRTEANGIEKAILTVDPSGHFAIFYQPNIELGYINPETGDLLTISAFPGTPVVNVVDAVVGGSGSIDAGLTNISQLVGLQYSNGQVIATDSNTVFHEDGSSMRSGSSGTTWKYDAGATLKSLSNYSWSNTVSMKSSGTYKHPNNTSFRNGAGSILYATGTTFVNNSTGEEFYPASVPMRNTAGVYSYEIGTQLDNSNVIHYPSGSTMVDQTGNVFNADGSPSTTPFSRHSSFTNSEATTTVSNVDSVTTIAAAQTVSGSPAAYVTRIHLIYRQAGDYNQNGIADASDYVLWRKNVGSSTALPNDKDLGTPIGQAHYDLWRANFGQTLSAAGAGVESNETVAEPPADFDKLSPGEPGAAGVAVVAAFLADSARQPPALPGVVLALDVTSTATITSVTAAVGQAVPDESTAASLQLLELQPRSADANDFEFLSSHLADDGPAPAVDPALAAVDNAFALLATNL